MNKRIVCVLTALLIVTMAVPVFADNHMEDNVEITGEVKSVIKAGNYSDDDLTAAELWADDDVLDEDYTADPDLFPAQKAFYQEIGFDVAGNVNNNINFNLAIDTLTNNFTEVTGPEADGTTIGDPGALDELVMDNALLTIADDVSTLKIGDMNGFHAETYFIDDEDIEGMEVTTAMNNNDLRMFLGSNDEDFAGEDFYGATYTKNYENGYLAGKLYGVRYDGDFLNNFAVAGENKMSDQLTVDGELVLNTAEENMGDVNASNGDGDTLIRAGADYVLSETVTVNGKLEMVGEDFASTDLHDLEEAQNYDLINVGGEMVLDENNTMNAAYTMVDHDGSEDKSTFEVGLENVNGEYTNNASIALTANDTYEDNSDVTVINLGTEYAMDAATFSAELTNQSSDYDNEFTYLGLGYDQTISESITWNSEFGYIDGTTGDANAVITDSLANEDGSGLHLETALTVSF